jgi:hypothetical protein
MAEDVTVKIHFRELPQKRLFMSNEQAGDNLELGFGFLASWPSDKQRLNLPMTITQSELHPRFQGLPQGHTRGQAFADFQALYASEMSDRRIRLTGKAAAFVGGKADNMWEEVAFVVLGISGMAGIALALA